MAGMLVPSLGLLPGVMWEAAFAAVAGWFAWRAIRARRRDGARTPPPGHYLPHLMESGAMLYMLAAVPAAQARAAAGGHGWLKRRRVRRRGVRVRAVPARVRGLDRRPIHRLARARARPARHRSPLAPRLVGCCQVAVSITMAYMLITML
jgi:hypothetical protein